MTWVQPPTDDELLAELHRAVAADDGPERATVELLLGGYDLITAEVVVAELAFDSEADLVAAVRDSGQSPRLLTFSGHEISIDLELEESAVRGFVGAVGETRLFLDQLGGSVPVEVDEVGAFEVEIKPSIAFRLRLLLADATAIATDWIDPQPR